MRHRGLILGGLSLFGTFIMALQGCSRSAVPFSDHNARAHVQVLAGTIGSRPAGTNENARARTYIIDQLKLYGYEVRVQETDARRSEFGLTAHVANIIAVLPGSRREAVGLLSHYDSSPDTPGAADDAFGVAVALEAARVIAGRARTWTTMVLVTDAEETGLMGAAALMTDREVADRLQAYINIEASGSAGGAMLFETGPANHWLLKPWSEGARYPRGASFALEIYKRLPNDTDFSILRRHEVPGLNFALVGDGYAYHTARDTPERLSPRSLRTTGENIVGLLDALQRSDITQRTSRTATYFDLGGARAVSYNAALDWLVAGFAFVLGCYGWLRVTRFVVGEEGPGRWLLGFGWTGLAVVAVVGAMIGATWLLRTAREVYHPWYAYPGRFFLMLASVGAFAAWIMTRLGRWIPERAHGLRHPSVVWTYTMPLWIVSAVMMSAFAPRAAYLWTLPLLVAGAMLSVVPVNRALFVRIGSAVTFVLCAMLWLRDTFELLPFMVAVFGRLPVVTPVYVFAALLTAAGLTVIPPLISAVAAADRLSYPRVITTIGLLVVTVTMAVAYRAPAYTYDQPLRRQARAFQEAGAAESIWLVGSIEPGVDLDDNAPGIWAPGRPSRSTSVPWGGLREPFLFSTTAGPLGPPPADISSLELQDVAGGIELTITVVPREPGLTVSFYLPEGASPARANLPGVTSRTGRWSATYVAPPPDGVTFRARFTGTTAERLRETRVAVTSARLPGGEGWQQLPRWMPQERMVWAARATWVLPHPATLEPVPALR
jgi:hypothetical protein